MINKNKIKRIVCIYVSFIMLLNNFGIAYAENEEQSILNKTESVFINTDSYGQVTKVNIYNNYAISNVNSIIDHGNYESIQVLTGNNTPVVSGDEISWKTSGDNSLGHIGKASNELAKQVPWNISIKYYLNGVETLAKDLPHANGLVKIVIKVTPNKEAPLYYQNNYMMEIQTSFDMAKYISISSEDAIEAQVGNTKSLTFMILPGHEKEVSLEIGSNDFSLDNITFAMVPLEGDILEIIQDAVEDKKSVRDAWDATNESLDVILNQLSSSSKNIDKVVKGTESLQNSLDNIVDNFDTQYMINSKSNERINNIENMIGTLDLLSGDFTSLDERVSTFRSDVSYIKQRIKDTKQLFNNLKNDLIKLNEGLSANIKDIERLETRSKDVTQDLSDISKLLADLKTSVKELNKLLDNVDDAGDIDVNAVKKNLTEVGSSTKSIAEQAGMKLQTEGEDPEFYMEVIGFAQGIEANLKKVQSELSNVDELMDDVNTNTKSLTKNLNNVQKDLDTISKEANTLSTYSKDIPKTTKNVNATLKSLQSLNTEMIDTIEEHADLDEKTINMHIDNLDAMLGDIQLLEKNAKLMNITIQNFLNIAKDDVNVVQTEVHTATQESVDGIQDLLGNLKGISNQSSSLKNSKNKIYDIVTSNLDDIENKTNIFDIDPNMEVVSFASSKNESPKKVQIFLQTEGIKEAKDQTTEDMEPKKEKQTFWDKLKAIFQKIVDFFKDLFGGK